MRMARVYDEPRPGDGIRVLVDRLWPRGLHRDDPRVGRWCEGVAPQRYDEFTRRYRAELAEPGMAPALDEIRHLAARGPVTLVTFMDMVEER